MKYGDVVGGDEPRRDVKGVIGGEEILDDIARKFWASHSYEQRCAVAERVFRDYVQEHVEEKWRERTMDDVKHASLGNYDDWKKMLRGQDDVDPDANLEYRWELFLADEISRRITDENIARINTINQITETQSPRYGYHTELAEVPSVLIMWSNGAESWFVGQEVTPGTEVEVDADEILVPFRGDEVREVLPFLNNHWAFRFSFEGRAKSGTFGDRAFWTEFRNRWRGSQDLVKPRLSRRTRRRVGPGRGWWRERSRHAAAARKGWGRRR